MEQRWSLCALCAIELTQTLEVKAESKPPVHGECRMCHKKRPVTTYIVNYKTKGDK